MSDIINSAKSNINASGIISPKSAYGYIPGLDGIRAIAVMLVLVAHFEISNLVPGGFGVTLFFFISGFLITRLLQSESTANGKISLKKFYIRRFIRLYPALIAMLLGNMIIFSLFNFPRPAFLEFISSLFYFANIYYLFHNIGLLTEMGLASPTMSWGPLWSLAVEEHFYLIFPLLMICFSKFRQKFVWILLAILIICPIWRVIINATTSTVFAETYCYKMTDTRIDSIVWGCLLSVMLNDDYYHAFLNRIIGYIPIILAGLTLLFCLIYRDVDFRNTIRFSLQGLAIFVLILNLYFSTILTYIVKMLDIRFIAYIGVLSYGAYLWHFPVIDWYLKMFDSDAIVKIFGLPTTFLIAHISFRYIESPFIALRKRYGAHVVNRAGSPSKDQPPITQH